ncbi:FAD-binding oxidoreductase [Sedimentitalea sp. XS_ASV28]|uniref:FAD-binding oxidoreductase n=1 Tax=Sedimentitalea sp. XS_ASV28 TaxID=3241296 RepID=UPI00351917C1
MTGLVDAIAAEIGRDRLVSPDDVLGRALDPIGRQAPATWLIRPRSTQEVSAVLRLCHAAGQRLTVMGGATGLAGGLALAEDEWLLSLEAMRGIDIDAGNRVATMGAGAILQDVQDRVAEAGLSFPLDLGSRGSATIGGLIACNAGGEKALRFGMMREQVLGLEVVLPDGRVIDLMNSMVKNNTGYDLKQLFIGAEGTLGVVTRAVLRLRPHLPSRQTGFAALSQFDAVLKLKSAVEEALGNDLTAFEIMWPGFFDAVASAAGGALPVERGSAYYVIFEAEGGRAMTDDMFIEALEPVVEAGLVDDLVLARSNAERDGMWSLRNNIAALIAAYMPPIGYDVSIPLGKMEQFVAAVEAGVAQRWPDMRMTAFGHMGDNNLHLVVTLGAADAADKEALNHLIYGEVGKLGGSISAEHGLGSEKRDYLGYSRSPEAIALMREVRTLFDPRGILQQGRLLPDAEPRSPQDQ